MGHSLATICDHRGDVIPWIDSSQPAGLDHAEKIGECEATLRRAPSE